MTCQELTKIVTVSRNTRKNIEKNIKTCNFFQDNFFIILFEIKSRLLLGIRICNVSNIYLTISICNSFEYLYVHYFILDT